MTKTAAEIRAGVGSHHATFEYDSDEVASKAYRVARNRIASEDPVTKAVSIWRYKSSDYKRNFVTIMAEQEEPIEALTTSLRPTAIARLEVPGEDPKMVDALRERRWQTAVESVARGASETWQEAHYGSGARLHVDGRMR